MKLTSKLSGCTFHTSINVSAEFITASVTKTFPNGQSYVAVIEWYATMESDLHAICKRVEELCQAKLLEHDQEESKVKAKGLGLPA